MKHFAELDSPLGDDLLFGSMKANETLCKPYAFAVTAHSAKPDLDFNKLLGQHVTVRMHMPAEESATPRFFDGLVDQVTLAGQNGRFYEYDLVLRPWFWFLSQTRDHRVFQNQTVLQIIDEVLQDHPIAAIEDRTTTGFTPWVYCVQYGETDFNFLSRLMEQEGIGYYFRHAAGRHTLVMFDSISGHDKCPGCAPLPVRYGLGGQIGGGDVASCAWDLTSTQRVQPGATVITDYDFTRTKMDLRQSRSSPGKHALGAMEVFEYPGYYDKEQDGDQFVRAQMEAYACATQDLGGHGDARGLCCGGLVTLKGSVRGSDNAEHLVTGTQIMVRQPERDSGGADGARPGYTCKFDLLPTALPFRPRRETAKPLMQGPQTAVVVGPAGEEIHTDKYGRVKVQFHWDRYGQKNEKSSCWVRVSTPWAGQSFGFVQIPRIGQEVVVDFLEGDPDQPLITGRVYNATQMPPWELPANATQSGVLTRSSKGGNYGTANAIRFEDKQGAEQLWIHAEKNQDIEVENDETHSVGHDRTKTVGHDEKTDVTNDRTETVGNNETITIGVNRTEKVGSNETISIGANRTEDVGVNETISIGANRTETVGANETVSVVANRSVTVGASETKHVALQRTRTVGVNETVGIGGAQEIGIGGLQAVVIGAVQTISVGANRSIDVGANLSTDVGANEKRGVGGGRSTTVGKDDSLKIANNLVIDAGDSITIKTGEASITMKKDGTIVIKGKDLKIDKSGKISMKASGNVMVKGSKILHN